MVVGSKRKRQAAAARSELDKFAHKSGVLLQREAKKVRAFQVRKGVQQLKQTRAQLEQRRSADPSGDGGAKLSATVQRLEREHEALKALDLRAVVQRAMLKTGLQKRQQQQHQNGAESDDSGSDDEDDAMRGGGDVSDDDDGFDSEEYENARRGGVQRGEDSDDSEDDSEDESEEEQEASAATTTAPDDTKQPIPQQHENEKKKAEEAEKKKKSADEQLQNTLIDRVLAHKQMKPLLEAIEKWLENEERETEKKLRRQEKKALKRDRNEVLIGGRSAAAPSSLFLGSLSGRGDVATLGDDGYGVTSSHMAGAEDDIAEFLGEKKKKNRAGQNARRQKAMRMEEAAKRKQDRENGVFRPYPARRDDSGSKYGLSERPKKKKPAVEGKGGKRSSDKFDKKDEKQKRAGNRERGAPASRDAAATGGRRPAAAAKVEVAHPSWIAKQALKEKEKASIGSFSGKKITFD